MSSNRISMVGAMSHQGKEPRRRPRSPLRGSVGRRGRPGPGRSTTTYALCSFFLLPRLLPSSGLRRSQHCVRHEVGRRRFAERRARPLGRREALHEVGDRVNETVLIADRETRRPPALHVGMVPVGDMHRAPPPQPPLLAVIEGVQAMQVAQVFGKGWILPLRQRCQRERWAERAEPEGARPEDVTLSNPVNRFDLGRYWLPSRAIQKIFESGDAFTIPIDSMLSRRHIGAQHPPFIGIVRQSCGDCDIIFHRLRYGLGDVHYLQNSRGMASAHECARHGHNGKVTSQTLHCGVAAGPANAVQNNVGLVDGSNKSAGT
jgi:hypothetical protein